MTTEQIIEYVLPQEEEAADLVDSQVAGAATASAMVAEPPGAGRPAGSLTVLRLVISEMNTLQHAKWLRLMRETGQWATETLGVPDDEEERKALPEETVERSERGYRRAAMLATLRRVESGTCAPDAEGPSEWQPAKLPVEWEGIDNFIDNMPYQLFDLWLAVASNCNPTAFFRPTETDQKKRTPGQVSVRMSMKPLTNS